MIVDTQSPRFSRRSRWIRRRQSILLLVRRRAIHHTSCVLPGCQRLPINAADASSKHIRLTETNNKKLSYRKQIAHQLRTQHVEGI